MSDSADLIRKYSNILTESRGTEQERGLEKLQFGKDKPKPTKQEKGLEKLQFGKQKKKVKEGEESSNLGISQGGNNEYESSVDFEDDASKLYQALKVAREVLSSPAWKDWMKQTDYNYHPKESARRLSREIEIGVADAQKLFDRLYQVMIDSD